MLFRSSEVLITVGEQQFSRKIQDFLANGLAKIDYRNPPSKSNIARKIKQHAKLLGDVAVIKAGVKMYEKGKGNPPQTEETLRERPYSVTGSSPNGWRPLYRGTDVTRFALLTPTEFVSYGPWLAAPRSLELFESPKILMRRTDDRLRCSIDYNSSICVNSCHVIKLKPDYRAEINYEFLVGVLNSRLTQYTFETSNPQMVGKVFAEIKVVYVEQLPIPHATEDQQTAIIILVQQILAAPDSPEVPRLEAEIDRLVYALYNLTDEEIALVEGKG